MRSNSSKTAVLVMGAPRSGTSAASHLLAELGVYFGDSERFVDPITYTHNPIFYELKSLNELNDEILGELGHVYGEFDYIASEHEPVVDKHRSFVARAQTLVIEELASRPLIGLKDPRFAFTLPLWEIALQSMGYETKIVLTDRSVDDVVRSNREVNKGKEAYNRRVAKISIGLTAARLVGRDPLIVNYDELVELPTREARRLADWLGLDPGSAERASQVVRAELRHHHGTGGNPNRASSSKLKSEADRYRAALGTMEEYGILELVESLRRRLSTALQGNEAGGGLVSVQNSMDRILSQMDSNTERLTALTEAAKAQDLAIERAGKDREAAAKLEAELQRRVQDLEAVVLERSRAYAKVSTDLNIAHGDIHQRDEQISRLSSDRLDLSNRLASVQQQYERTKVELRAEIDALRRQNAALMPLRKKLSWYYRTYGGAALLKRVLLGRSRFPPFATPTIPLANVGAQDGAGTRLVMDDESNPEHEDASRGPEATAPFVSVEPAAAARLLVSRRFDAIQPLPIFASPGPDVRLNLVTDSINTGSLFGGVGTAIILSALLADRLGAKLRVVTRTEPAGREGFGQVLACNGIEFHDEVEFEHVGVGNKQARLPVCEGDRFLTTSWWTTACVLGSIPAARVDYLLQEDERMFYPHGDDRLRCREVLERRDIRFVINTELLYQHLVGTGLGHLRENAVWFEPAFPTSMFHWESAQKADGKKRLFFYARPNNLRNLFYRGIEVLDTAVTEKIITPDEWDVVMVGKDVPALTLGGALRPKILSTMSWKAYGEFIRSVDLGFCLMDTPHPSYPPLDLAASGAVVLTNKFGMKEDLRKYSDNIICSDSSVSALIDGMREAIIRVRNEEVRLSAFQTNRIARSWPETLAKSVEFLG